MNTHSTINDLFRAFAALTWVTIVLLIGFLFGFIWRALIFLSLLGGFLYLLDIT